MKSFTFITLLAIFFSGMSLAQIPGSGNFDYEEFDNVKTAKDNTSIEGRDETGEVFFVKKKQYMSRYKWKNNQWKYKQIGKKVEKITDRSRFAVSHPGSQVFASFGDDAIYDGGPGSPPISIINRYIGNHYKNTGNDWKARKLLIGSLTPEYNTDMIADQEGGELYYVYDDPVSGNTLTSLRWNNNTYSWEQQILFSLDLTDNDSLIFEVPQIKEHMPLAPRPDYDNGIVYPYYSDSNTLFNDHLVEYWSVDTILIDTVNMDTIPIRLWINNFLIDSDFDLLPKVSPYSDMVVKDDKLYYVDENGYIILAQRTHDFVFQYQTLNPNGPIAVPKNGLAVTISGEVYYGGKSMELFDGDGNPRNVIVRIKQKGNNYYVNEFWGSSKKKQQKKGSQLTSVGNTVFFTNLNRHISRLEFIPERNVNATPVDLPTCAVFADFSYVGSSVNSNVCDDYYQFTDLSHGLPFTNVSLYTWGFGDGTYSNDPNPSHLYTSPGNYEVCLIVGGENADGLTCTSDVFCQSLNVCFIGDTVIDNGGGSGKFAGTINISGELDITATARGISVLFNTNNKNEYRISVLNTVGQLVKEGFVHQQKKSLNVSLEHHQPYFIQVRNKDGQLIRTKKVVFVE